MYTDVFATFKEVAPYIKFHGIMSDFEPAISNAAKKIYDGIIIEKCYFHYAQVI